MVAYASGCNAVTVNGAVGIAVDKFYDMENESMEERGDCLQGLLLCIFWLALRI